MNRNFMKIALPLLVCAAAQAATVSTTLSVTANAAGAITGTSIATTGTATLTNIGTGTFSATFSILTYQAPYTITLSGGTITGVITTTAAILTGAATGSATVTGGTGTYAGATGSFPSLAGNGAIGASGITLTFNGAGTITTGGGTGPVTPTITGIANNYSFIQKGFPNYGIAPGALFVIAGTGLADSTATAVLQDSSKSGGIPLTLNGASLTVTVANVTTHPAIYYAIAGQIAAVLPMGTPVGTGTITVTYNNVTSAAATITVVPAALGIGTYNGLAIATSTSYVLYTPTNSAKPGDTIILWGSGLGATVVADSDTTFATPHAAIVQPQIYIGGIQAQVLYAGGSGFPGVNQINVTIPAGVSPGCGVSLVALSTPASGAAITSNTTAIPVAAGGGVCADPAFGTNGTTIQSLTGQGTVNSGSLFLAQATSPATSGGGTQVNTLGAANFTSTTGASFASGTTLASLGSCAVAQSNSASGSAGTSKGLDAGTISVSGPSGSAAFTANPVVAGSYFATPANGFIPASGGTFTFTGTGGKDVGSFTTSVTFPNPLLTWTNTAASATVARASGQAVTWSGGASNSYVLISGSSTSGTLSGSYYCYVPQSAGQFTVPSYILLSLPAGTGNTLVENATNFTSFTAKGLDSGYAFGAVFQQVNTTFN